MNIDKRLNIILKVEGDDGSVMHVHSTPILASVYEANWRLITKTAVDLYGDGLGIAAAARVAMLALRDTARAMDGPDWERNKTFQTMADALLNEIWRQTTVVIPGERGWDTVAFYDVVRDKLIDGEQLSEVKNALTFFTLASWFHRASERKEANEILKHYGALIVSSTAMEFASSLPTSTAVVSTGEKATPLFIPV